MLPINRSRRPILGPGRHTNFNRLLRFNRREFCDGLYVHRKTLRFAFFVDSGTLLLMAG